MHDTPRLYLQHRTRQALKKLLAAWPPQEALPLAEDWDEQEWDYLEWVQSQSLFSWRQIWAFIHSDHEALLAYSLGKLKLSAAYDGELVPKVLSAEAEGQHCDGHCTHGHGYGQVSEDEGEEEEFLGLSHFVLSALEMMHALRCALPRFVDMLAVPRAEAEAYMDEILNLMAKAYA